MIHLFGSVALCFVDWAANDTNPKSKRSERRTCDVRIVASDPSKHVGRRSFTLLY